MTAGVVVTSGTFTVDVAGVPYTIGYEPGESGTAMYGGNSNWRGPVWMPVNHLLVESLDRYARLLPPDTQVPSPDGGTTNLGDLSLELRDNLISLFLPAADGIRPCNRSLGHLAGRAGWDEPLFFEFFHGDDGTGLGASHQTGWTGLVADLILRDPRHHTPPPHHDDDMTTT